MKKSACFAILFLTAPLQSSEWRLGLSLPLYDGGIGLWRTGEKWGFGTTLGGPTIGKTETDKTTAHVSGALMVQRFKGRVFFFGEMRGEYSRSRWFEEGDRLARLKIGIGINRKYKDFGLFISHGLTYELEEFDGVSSWAAGLENYPRVVAYWTF